MKANHVLAGLLVLAASSVWIPAQQGIDEAVSPHLYAPADIEWKEGPPSLPAGAKFSVLEGDPAKEGMFVMRLRVPDGYHIPAHTHPKPERVTVLQGTFKLAMGENPTLAGAQSLPMGSYGVWPAGMVHAAWFEGETILQVHGLGPWGIQYVNPADDPRSASK